MYGEESCNEVLAFIEGQWCDRLGNHGEPVERLCKGLELFLVRGCDCWFPR